ncbi:MAG: cell wall metabolism sensor histidine kinase WalK, partial [Proteobacteria bacterium]|nr:cell wall metabolism sensor histidine kinase WalK [Pseudomonadota bacterium]
MAEQVERDALNRIEQTMLNQALALAPTMTPFVEKGEGLSSEELMRLTPGINSRITLIASDGRVLADNQKNPNEMDNHGSRPEVVAATTSTYGTAARYSDTLNLSMLYLAIEIRSVTGKIGFLRLALPLTFVDEQMNALQNRIVISAIAVGLLFLVLGYFLAYRVTRPVTRMTEIARNVAKGEYELRLPTEREDEIGQLAVVINELALGAQQRIDELVDNRNRLAAVLAGLTEGVIAVDTNQNILHINDAALSMLNLEAKQVLNKSFGELAITVEIKRALETCTSEQT